MCLDVYCTEEHWPWHIAAWVKDYVNKPKCFLQANKKLLKGIQHMLQGVQIQVLFMSRKKCNTVSITFLYTTYMALQIVYAVCRYTHISRRKDWKRRGVGKTSLFQDQLTWVLSQPASHSEQWSPTWTPHFSFFFFLPELLSEFVYFAWQISVFLPSPPALPSVLKWAELCLKYHELAPMRVLTEKLNTLYEGCLPIFIIDLLLYRMAIASKLAPY